MYVCKAYLWNKESFMVYNLERKQKELKCLHEYLLRRFNFNVAPVSTSPHSAIDLGRNNDWNDKSPPPPPQVILEFLPN